jgi:glutaminyl-tRNA synthetase
MTDQPAAKHPRPAAPNFIRNIIAEDLERGTYAGRRWAGAPGVYDRHVDAPEDRARIRTRFPPEPNGYLHIGHAKSICLNFGLARDFGGRCHMRFDDTNPVKEDQEFVDAILESVRWLGFDWEDAHERNLYHASDYFDDMFGCAEHLVATGYAYVDEQSAEQMRATRGTLTEAGVDSPFRDRPIADNLRLLHEMRAGRHAEGSLVLRARIDMASPNINLRDPAIYRIRFAAHHMTGERWCIYPMYAYAHPLEDALENITHSICTLEFEDQRPFYDWVLERCAPVLRAPQFARARAHLERIAAQGIEARREFALVCRNVAERARDKLGHSRYERRVQAMFASWSRNPDLAVGDADEFFRLLREQTQHFTPLLQHALAASPVLPLPNAFLLPHQHEFNRLNLSHVILSKRRLIELVDSGAVDGWDDPRLPTLVGLRRRGYTPHSIQLFMERIGVSKSTQWIDYALLEQALRDDLETRAPRATAVLEPLRLVLDNWPDGRIEPCLLPLHPQRPELGTRSLPFARELWIERSDFMEDPPKGYHRLVPGGLVRLRNAYVIRATAFERDADGRASVVHAEVLPDTRSGTEGASRVKVKGTIHWLPVHASCAAEVRLYERLFRDPQPDADGKPLRELLNPDSRRVRTAFVEPSLAQARAEDTFQFERNGYFVADRKDHSPGRPVFNLAVTLKDAWGR